MAYLLLKPIRQKQQRQKPERHWPKTRDIGSESGSVLTAGTSMTPNFLGVSFSSSKPRGSNVLSAVALAADTLKRYFLQLMLFLLFFVP